MTKENKDFSFKVKGSVSYDGIFETSSEEYKKAMDEMLEQYLDEQINKVKVNVARMVAKETGNKATIFNDC